MNVYDKTKWGIHIIGPDAILPAESFKFANDYVTKHNDWISRKIIPDSLEDDPIMFGLIFIWDEEEWGVHDPASVDWDDPI